MTEQLLRGEADSGGDGDTMETWLADNRLNLDVCPDGVGVFFQLYKRRRSEVQQVEFLRINCNEVGVGAAVTLLPTLRNLKSLVLKGGHVRNELGVCQCGVLSDLPAEFGLLKQLSHLDLSFNCFSTLPECIMDLPKLTKLLLCHNQLSTLPDTIGRLKSLTFLSVMKNLLQSLPESIRDLTALQILDVSENALQFLPKETGELSACTKLDLSGNHLQTVPDSLANLLSLCELILHSNCLTTVPANLASLPNLSRLDLQNNSLRFVPPEIQDSPFVQLKGNPLNIPEVPKPQDEPETGKLRELKLASDDESFIVTSVGYRVFLPCGMQLCFPPGAISMVTIHCRVLTPDPHLLKLTDHDLVLSQVLELQPHGIEFQQEVEVRMPYTPTRFRRRREVVLWTFDGNSWSDLETVLEESAPGKVWAVCRVCHFSWFVVISRLVVNRCPVPHQGALLFSTVDPNIKVTFPPGATEETRMVKMQVLQVSAEEIQEMAEDSDSITSPLVCLSQSSTANFLKPVKIQLPLPPGVTALNLDRSKLHLLHGDAQAYTWTDITQQVVLEFTHLYAFFEVTHFSWYWLWYTTKAYVGGIAKKVYERLRLYPVNFLALQRKRDPEQVLLQCVSKHKVDMILNKLQDRYRGPEPSDVVDLFEGEQFFAAFEKGLDIDADRPDCLDGRISFTFYSYLKNSKEIYVTSPLDRRVQAVKGQVSFYRGDIPDNIPEDATKRRKGLDSHWLATLPLKLPKLKSQARQDRHGNHVTHQPLNLGNEETGYLTEANLLGIARQIGADWRKIGINLGFSYQDLQRIEYNNREDLDKQILEMLFSWAHLSASSPDSVKKLIQAMEESDRQDIADEIQSVIALGKQKYRESIRRVGLDPESSNEDFAIAMV
ncbi:p53-induced death domain-containing protein 1 [Latimeria chalumnae]|uniref:p53-induced death domain-containing protein 1 n=1 Tax=Latimeria chalumnae TaxID=7897 RepID=UPI00313B03D1